MELKYEDVATGKGFSELLIVPYGIEIKLRRKQNDTSKTFNCTLWN